MPVMDKSAEKSCVVHLQPGREQRVAVVFSCPGRHEEAAGHPAAGSTGRNLDRLLALVGEGLGRSDLCRENITITNAWPTVEYRARTGRSEATSNEVTAAGNIERLERELGEVTDFVIFCGERAKAVSARLRLKHSPGFVFVRHLGLRGLSLIRRDLDGEPIIAASRQACAGGKLDKKQVQRGNTEKRLEVLAQSVLAQLKGG